MRPGDGVGEFLLAVAGDDRRLDLPHLEPSACREETLAEIRRVSRIVAAEERGRICQDLFRCDAEELPHPLADIGVANVAIGRDAALIDDAGDARCERGEALVGEADRLSAPLELESDRRRSAQQVEGLTVALARFLRRTIEYD